MPRQIIYLDNNATTPLTRAAAQAMTTCLKSLYGNPSSSHCWGARAKKAVDNARAEVAALVGALPEEIIFTSSGTEANNLAIIGIGSRFRSGHIVTSAIEHPSVSGPLKHLEERGFEITRLGVDSSGRVSPEAVRRHLQKNTILLSIMHANNETGVIQPVEEIGGMARKRLIPFHCDAAQSAGKIPVHVGKVRADLLTIVPHKYHGPKGIAALYVRQKTQLKPLLYGASQERGLRPGTENVAAIVGFGKASLLARRELASRRKVMNALSRLLAQELKRYIPGVRLNGHPRKRLPNTLNITFPGVKGHLLVATIGRDVAASTGSACHAGGHEPSPVLKEMGLSDEEALSSLRLSLGVQTTEGQVRRAARIIAREYRRLSDQSLLPDRRR